MTVHGGGSNKLAGYNIAIEYPNLQIFKATYYTDNNSNNNYLLYDIRWFVLHDSA